MSTSVQPFQSCGLGLNIFYTQLHQPKHLPAENLSSRLHLRESSPNCSCSTIQNILSQTHKLALPQHGNLPCFFLATAIFLFIFLRELSVLALVINSPYTLPRASLFNIRPNVLSEHFPKANFVQSTRTGDLVSRLIPHSCYFTPLLAVSRNKNLPPSCLYQHLGRLQPGHVQLCTFPTYLLRQQRPMSKQCPSLEITV